MLSLETRLANEKLLVIRGKEREKEGLEEVKRIDDAKKKEIITEKRNELQRLKHEKVQAQKQRMIDRAIEHLSKLEQSTEKRLDNQKKEVREKEDKEFAHRAHRRALEKESIDDSRSYQLNRIATKARKEFEEAGELSKEWVSRNLKVEGDMKREELREMKSERDLSQQIKAQAEAREQIHMEANALKFLEEQNSKNILLDEDSKYRRIAAETLQSAQKANIKNTYPLKKALVAKSIDMLPASGFRV